MTVFQKRFAVEKVPPKALFVIKALKVVKVRLDGEELQAPRTSLTLWKKPIEIDLAPKLRPGDHVLNLSVYNEGGHPALLAYCKELVIYTGPDWEASEDPQEWNSALPVDEPPVVELSRQFPTAGDAFIEKWPVFISLFSIVFLLTILWSKYLALNNRFSLNASHLRFLLLSAGAVLALNNIFKMPPDTFGFDHAAHMDYIRYVAEKMRLPLATEGWQMFQPPLYYILSASIYKVCSGLTSASNMEQVVRVFPLFCGALQVEIGYRTMRLIFPERNDLQMIGTLICGTLPMNIYMSQVIGNEPLAGLFSAIVLFLSLKWLTGVPQGNPTRSAALLGLFLGLALLSKATAFLLIPLVIIHYFLGPDSGPRGWKGICEPVVVSISIAGLVAGGYYIRNWITFGKPFIGGWDPIVKIWWQDPGYRTLEHFVSFGEALVHPIYASVQGFWDAIYSTMWLDGTLLGVIAPFPPWNYGFMLAGAWLALPVAIAIVVGMFWPFPGRARNVQIFSDMVVILYLAALLFLFLTLPIYSTAKATYTLGLMPLYGILAVMGFRPLLANQWLRASVYGWLACFGIAAYCSYLIF